jgi:hypothetical protein
LWQGSSFIPIKLKEKLIGKASYPDVAIQDAAYKVMAGLRAHCFELQTSYAFIDFP